MSRVESSARPATDAERVEIAVACINLEFLASVSAESLALIEYSPTLGMATACDAYALDDEAVEYET